MSLSVKQIIQGTTYNTSTATLVHKYVPPDQWDKKEEKSDFERLYRTRQGEFFLLINLLGYVLVPRDASTSHYKERWVPQIKPLTSAQALTWLNEHGGTREQIKQQFPHGLPKGWEPESTVYVRIPDSLKRRLETCAKSKGQSLNLWAMRWLEYAAAVEESGKDIPPLPSPTEEKATRKRKTPSIKKRAKAKRHARKKSSFRQVD